LANPIFPNELSKWNEALYQGLKQLPVFSNILAALERLCGWLHWGFNWSSLQSPTFPLLNFQVVSCCLA
jgi:hypothetical protein